MSQLVPADQVGSLVHLDSSQGTFRGQLATLINLVRQVAGDAAISAGNSEAADPLSAPFTLYVNPYTGSDRFVGGSFNSHESTGSDEDVIRSKLKRIEEQRLVCGYSPQRPFRTINRAVIEAAIITSKNWYTFTDPRAHLDCVSIVLAPAGHTIHNDPGSSSTNLDSWGLEKDPTVADLIAFNPATVGGVLLPRGCSLCGPDLRKTSIRPTWVPAIADEAADYSNRRAMLKVTGTGYFFGFTAMDKVGHNESHHLLDLHSPASKNELDAFYAKCVSAVGSGADLASALTTTRSTEHEIVGPINLLQSPSSAWDTTSGASPYIFNCSVRSNYGLGGAFWDGDRVGGLKSMVCANFTGVSKQRDMRCWQVYENGVWVNLSNTPQDYQKYINTAPDDVRMDPARQTRHITAINDAFIQEVSVFGIGQAGMNVTDNGGEITITNSNSTFGGCAAISKGYKRAAFPKDKNWTISRIKAPLSLSEKASNIRRIYLGVITAISGSNITLSTGLAADPASTTIPAVLLRDGYSLAGGTRIWIENSFGVHWRATLTSSAWSSASPAVIGITAAPLQAGTNDPIGINPTTGLSFAIGQRVYVRRLVDTRTPAERRLSLLLNNTASVRMPQRNFVLQTDPQRSGGAISRVLSGDGPEVLLVSNVGTGPAAGSGVTKTAEISLRRGAANKVYTEGAFYRVGTVVRHANKHWQAKTTMTAVGVSPDPALWGETYVHMPSSFNPEDWITQEAPILILDTDTSDDASSTTLGISWSTIWTSAGSVRNQYRSGTDYLGVHALLMALGLTSGDAHAVLVPRPEAGRLLNPASSTDFPVAPTGGAATGRGNWAIEFRRPSVLRLYGHAWEWAGFGNYSKALPAVQQDMSEFNKFTYYFTNAGGGRVVPQGSNEDGYNITPRGLEDIETGATLSVDNLDGVGIDDQGSFFPNGIAAGGVTTVQDLVINGLLSAGPGSEAKTSRFGVGQLATIQDIDTQVTAATDNEALDAAADQVIVLPGLERWRQQRNLLAGVQPGATLVILHVASSPANAITGAGSVPYGYPTTGNTYEINAPGPRGQLYSSVTAALTAAGQIYVPVGSEILISVHDALPNIEAGPLTIGNGITSWVLAGARDAVNPKVNIKVGTTTRGTIRLPQNELNAYIVGGCVADIEIAIDCTTASSSLLYLTLDGGFSVGKRDTVIRWSNIAANLTLNNATCSYGGQIRTRIYHGLTEGDRTIRTILEKGNETATPQLVMFGEAGGLLGHGANLIYEFKESLYGESSNSTLIYKFEHDFAATVPLSFYRLGGRGGCQTGSRVGPQIKWNFSADNWNLSGFVSNVFYENKNYNGRSFRTIPAGEATPLSAYGINATSAATLAPIQLKAGCTLDINSEAAPQGGVFSLLLELEGLSYGSGTIPTTLITARNYEGSYVYKGLSSRNITTP